jgi:hypothetical protein
MAGLVINLEQATLQNDNFRKVLNAAYSPPEHADGTVHPTKADDTGHDH